MVYKKNELLKSRVKRVIKLYSKMLMNDEIDWITLKNIYNRSVPDSYAEFTIKRIVKQKGSQQMIESEILALYESKGITPEKVIEKELQLYDLSEEHKSFNVNERILDKWGKRTGLDPKQVTTTAKITFDYKALLETVETKQVKEHKAGDVKQLKEKIEKKAKRTNWLNK